MQKGSSNIVDGIIEKATLGDVVLWQMNRVNQLWTYEMNRAETMDKKVNVFLSIKAGLRSIEAVLSHDLPESYYGNDAEAKKVFKNFQKTKKYIYSKINFENPDIAIDTLGDYYDLIVSNLGSVGLLPKKTIAMSNDQDWSDVIPDNDDSK
ncbi:MAG: hypothetical protein CL528_13385 [Aequorivita sp.]|jgi:hypothetical protein|nr:hypothetical protein [Aequorivita sp.]|tara:strand:+ start:10252 stop:10704 length:453 start_codon:yes stop_codon:yes gene_type:complete